VGENMKKEATKGVDNPLKLFFEVLKNHHVSRVLLYV
jgi:hypothetical protein